MVLNVCSAYKAAAESYLGTVGEKQGCNRCKENMAKIKDMETRRNPDLNIDRDFERPTSRDVPFLLSGDATSL